MNRKPLAPAPNSITNVAQIPIRTHSRTSHGGSGTYTEIRAQIRRERELGKTRQQDYGHAREPDTHSKRVASTNNTSVTSLPSSASDQKVGQISIDGTNEALVTKKIQMRSLPVPSSFAMSSDNVSNMSNSSSQVSSSSSSGFVQKRTQTVSTHHQQQHSQLHYHQHHLSLSQKQDSFSRPAEDLALSHHVQSTHESPEQVIGVDALQAAFSAKYYELANKCKNWEKFAAKLRAQLEFLEAENRVLREQNAELETDNVQLRATLRQEEKVRSHLEGRMNTLEDCISQRSHSSGNLGGQYRAAEPFDYDHLSVPSAPSSAERKIDHSPHQRSTPYCSSNLQVEDRTELRRAPPSETLQAHVEAQAVRDDGNAYGFQSQGRQRSASVAARETQYEGTAITSAATNKRDSASLADAIHQDADNRDMGAFYGGGRDSRLDNRNRQVAGQVSQQRAGTVGAFGLPAPRAGSVQGNSTYHALTTQALAQQEAMEAIVRPASAQRFDGTIMEANGATVAPSIAANTGVTKAALQSKRRSTVSGDRGPSLSLAQIVKGALTASGVVAAQSATSIPSRPKSHQTSPTDKATVHAEYLQEYVEKRREAMRSSFHAQQQQSQQNRNSQLSCGQPAPSRPPSRAASRLSSQSGIRCRSRAGSVHDAIPVAVEDVFCDPRTFKAHSTDTSPVLVTEQLALAAPGEQNGDVMAASQRLMAATSDMSVSKLKLSGTATSPASSPSVASVLSPASVKSQSEQMTFERKLYIRFQNELNQEEFFKFERCIQRYDFLDIPLEGPKGLITRVKRLLLVSDPDLRSKPDKLRVRQQLARDFESMAKGFGQSKAAQS